jgi:hypothetical protein
MHFYKTTGERLHIYLDSGLHYTGYTGNIFCKNCSSYKKTSTISNEKFTKIYISKL